MSRAVDHKTAPAKTRKSIVRLEKEGNDEFERRWPEAAGIVLGMLLRETQDPELADDLFQLVSVKALWAVHFSPKPIDSFVAYCVHITKNVVIDNYRKTACRPLEVCCQMEDHNEPASRPEPEDMSEKLREMLKEFLPQLSKRELAVACGVLDGKTAEQIGADLKRTPRRVLQIVGDISERVKNFFGSNWF